MPTAPRFLVAESETKEARDARRRSSGKSSGETYCATLKAIVPTAVCEIVRPIEQDAEASSPTDPIDSYDAVFISGSPMHVYEDGPEVRRQLEFMRAVFEAGTPSFGSCAGLQVAVAAAGGTVCENRNGHEVAIARRITPTAAGRSHPLLSGRPAAFDALSLHSDEVKSLPPEAATLLATNGVTPIQAVEIRQGPGVFWGVQYHPELSLPELAQSLRRQGRDAIEQGLARTERDVEDFAVLLETLGHDHGRKDLAWRLGVDAEVIDDTKRRVELINFIEYLVYPTRSRRGRG